MLLTDSKDEVVLMDLGSTAPASVTVSSRFALSSTALASCSLTLWHRQEALALQELCAQTCTAHYRSVCGLRQLLLLPWVYILAYRAPELFEVPSSATITASSDVWSLGCCVYASAFGHSPFDGSALAAMSGRISFPRHQWVRAAILQLYMYIITCSSYSEELCDCIQWVLQVEPAHRPSVTQIQDRLCSLLPTLHPDWLIDWSVVLFNITWFIIIIVQNIRCKDPN